MEKQIEIVQEISRAINANLASITKGAVMQSAASKELDKDGEKAFSEYMSYVLKAFEEEVGSLFYEYKSITGKPTIIYPVFKDNTEEKEKIEDIKDGSAKKDPENMEGDTE